MSETKPDVPIQVANRRLLGGGTILTYELSTAPDGATVGSWFLTSNLGRKRISDATALCLILDAKGSR